MRKIVEKEFAAERIREFTCYYMSVFSLLEKGYLGTEYSVSDNFGFLEDEDRKTFAKIEEELERGAMIYFAVEDGVALATCMAKPMDGRSWEICKLGSNKNRPHIYEKYGFREIKLDDYEYVRGDIAFEKVVEKK